MAPVVILFARAPVPGTVKTRLAASIGEEAALQLHSAFVEDLVRALQPGFDVELHTDIPCDAWPELKVPRRIQISGDPGERMWFALDHALDRRRQVAAIIETNSPTLPVAHIESLLQMVSEGCDVALGPARGGGLWGIAARRLRPRMFHDVEWSTENTLAQTMASCASCDLATAVAKNWYAIDSMDDLRRMRDDLALLERPLTRALVESLLS